MISNMQSEQLSDYLSAFIWHTLRTTVALSSRIDLSSHGLLLCDLLFPQVKKQADQSIQQGNYKDSDWYLKMLSALEARGFELGSEERTGYLRQLRRLKETAATSGIRIPGYNGIPNDDPFWSLPPSWPPVTIITQYQRWYDALPLL